MDDTAYWEFGGWGDEGMYMVGGDRVLAQIITFVVEVFEGGLENVVALGDFQ